MQTNQQWVNIGCSTMIHHRNNYKFPECWNKFNWSWTWSILWFPVAAFSGFARDIQLFAWCLLHIPCIYNRVFKFSNGNTVFLNELFINFYLYTLLAFTTKTNLLSFWKLPVVIYYAIVNHSLHSHFKHNVHTYKKATSLTFSFQLPTMINV